MLSHPEHTQPSHRLCEVHLLPAVGSSDRGALLLTSALTLVQELKRAAATYGDANKVEELVDGKGK